MNLTNKQAKEIYQQFGDEKIICGIKNPNLKIKFMMSYIWLFPVCIILGFILNQNMLQILDDSHKVIAFIELFSVIGIAILGFLCESYTVYFEDNSLIFKNKLNKKKIIDINKYPRIYIRYRKNYSYDSDNRRYQQREEYDLHIEQNNNIIILDIRIIGGEKVSLLLDSFQMKEESEVSESQWQSSANEKEKKFYSIMKVLNSKKRIIGVRDTSKNMKIKISSLIIFNFLKIVLIASICLFIYLLFIKEWIIASYIIAFIFVLIVVLIEEKGSLYIDISYPSKNSIKINKYLLNYKDNNVMIYLVGVQLPKLYQKYNYKLVLSGIEKKYTIDLTGASEEKIEEFISNLIFQEN